VGYVHEYVAKGRQYHDPTFRWRLMSEAGCLTKQTSPEYLPNRHTTTKPNPDGFRHIDHELVDAHLNGRKITLVRCIISF
jgi:hypothetical protein